MALRKICTKLGRKGTEAIRLEPGFLEVDQRKREITWVETSLERSNLSHILGFSPGAWREDKPSWLGRGANGARRKAAVGSMDSTHEEYINACWLLKHRVEWVNSNYTSGWLLSCDCLGIPPSLSWENISAWLALHCSSTLEWGLPCDWGKV